MDRLQQDFLSLNFDILERDRQSFAAATRHQDESSAHYQTQRGVPATSIKYECRGDTRQRDGQPYDLSLQSQRDAFEDEQEAANEPIEIDMMIFQAELNELFDSTCFTNEEITHWIEVGKINFKLKINSAKMIEDSAKRNSEKVVSEKSISR